jgi:DNA polymerase-1
MYLVDAHSLIFQVFHAIGEMSGPTGLPVNAVFGFARDLLFLRAKKPAYLICAFDRGEPTVRTSVYKEYKAHRPPIPDDLCSQLPLIEQLVEAMHVPELSAPGYEADDVIATVARAASKRGIEVFICTSDKDCRQLIDDHVRLYNLRKHAEFGREELLKDWGITPEQVVDFQSLVGDKVDNVPGVPLIGEKTAAALLQQFGTLDNILANVGKVPGAKKQENLRAWAAQDQVSRRLVRLETEVPIALDWEGWRLKPWDEARLVALFRDWGFRSFAAQVRGESSSPSATAPQPAAGNGTTQGELFPFGANTEESATAEQGTGDKGQGTKDNWQATYRLIDTPKKFRDFFKELKKQKRVAIDLETTSLNPLEADVVGYALSWKEGEAHYLAVRGPQGAPLLDPAQALAQLREVLQDPAVAKVNQNIKYDLLVLRNQGVVPVGVAGDPMVAHYLLHAGQRSHNLEYLAQEYLHHQVIPITDLIGKKPRANEKGARQLRMDEVPTERVAEYSGEDADVALRLAGRLEPELAARGLADLYRNLEVPLIEVLAELEFNGIRLDIPMLKRVGEDMNRQLAGFEKEIHAAAGHEFNIASPKQLRQVLFDELKLPVKRKTGVTGEASTDQETLEELAADGKSPIPQLILQHRQIAKLKGTYVDALPEAVNPRTGRVHASFNQTVAATGRLSSSDPNLQNIPIRRDLGRQIRAAFLPAEGWRLLTADYSQIELRLLAQFCGDAELRRAFAEDRDVHASVAAQIFGVAEKDVSAEMRRMAKTVNFGVIYGISAHGLAQRLGIKREEGEKFIDAYFARYPKVQEYQARLLEECRRTGYVATILGRRREFDRGNVRRDSTYKQRNQTEREAINMEIQGSAADLIKLAMLHIYRRLKDEKRQARMLLQIHDELVFEVPPDEFEAVPALVREEMTTPRERELNLQVPLKVDLAAGPNWLDVDEV